MNTEDLAYMLRSHGICEILDDLNNTGLPDIVLFSGGHAIFIFTNWSEEQQHYAKRLSYQLAPHFIWKYYEKENAMGEYHERVVFVPYSVADKECILGWLDHIEEENKDFDYLEKYSEES